MKISVKQILAGVFVSAVLAGALLFIIPALRRSAPASSHRIAAPAAAPDTIALGFYNVENLFDLNYDGTEYPEYRPGALGWNQQTFDKKIANIASAIVALNVDIIGLCEIENRGALEALRKALKKRGTVFPYSAMADVPARGTTSPSLLSKYPIVQSQAIAAGGGGKAGRNILEADVRPGAGCTLKVFVNHWPSKMHPESERLVMARALEARTRALPAQCDYVLIGDMNTDYDEWSRVRTSGLDDTKGEVGLNHVLKTVHGGPDGFLSYVTKGEMCRIDSPMVHCDLWLEIPESLRFTRKYRNMLETPDHILLPASLFDAPGLSYLDGSFRPFTWNGTLLRDGVPYRWQMKGFGKRKFHAGEGYSDHLPLRVCVVRKPWRCDTSAQLQDADRSVENSGFEKSAEGWTGPGREIEVCRDTVSPFAGKFCLRLKGVAGKNNVCAGRTVLHFENPASGHTVKISFALRGQGKLCLRIRRAAAATMHKGAPKEKWRYYKGESFEPSGSSRFLPVSFKSWRQITLVFISDASPVKDIEFEIRAGKESSFCFYLDNVKTR